MEAIYVDLHVSKLTEWLQKRKLCQGIYNWKASLELVKSQADVVLRECESDTKEIKDIFVDRCSLIDICYFDYEKAFDILINNSSNEKNMFGQFLCPKLKALDSALVNYRKQNAHIAEASYILMNGIHFALPTLKKQINKSSLKIKQIESSLSRVQRLKLSAESTIKHHMTEWKIDMGESFEDAIDSKAICLSEICNEIGLKAISIKRAYEFYSLFVSTFHSKKPETVMDALLYLIEHGNTTVYEMKHHVAPASLCRPQVNLKNEHKSAIDEEGCIDWGDNIEETDKNQCYEAMNSDALTILEFKNTREQIFQAVCQIFAFFKQRLISSVDVDYDYITDQVVHDYLEMLSNNEAVENMFNDVKWLYDQLSGQEFIRLCSIWDSPKKLQITNDLIVKRISDIRTLEEQERMLQLELHNLIESDDNLKSDLNRLLKQLKSLKEKICSAIEETSSQNIKVSLAGCGQLQDSN